MTTSLSRLQQNSNQLMLNNFRQHLFTITTQWEGGMRETEIVSCDLVCRTLTRQWRLSHAATFDVVARSTTEGSVGMIPFSHTSFDNDVITYWLSREASEVRFYRIEVEWVIYRGDDKEENNAHSNEGEGKQRECRYRRKETKSVTVVTIAEMIIRERWNKEKGIRQIRLSMVLQVREKWVFYKKKIIKLASFIDWFLI